ncbi:hypothetical protein H663_017025 [Limnohabitans planktonicus II-D5]|uniref:Uncharacterized protein n=1 Tax=Limnohabitans planktonicus II-D5 TaxID=1293045 RepID=A0A2T7U9Z3_9BURK|nr:hypothetical protein H663_017025 [Limnohabitans planktonicus II-D5]
MPAQVVGAGVLPEGVGWPEAFFGRHHIDRPIAVQLAVKAEQVTVHLQFQKRVVVAGEQVGIARAGELEIHAASVDGVNVLERTKGGAIKTPVVHDLVGRVTAMKQAQIHAGFLGPYAVNGCIDCLCVVGHIASLLQRRSAYERGGALCTRALPG